MIQANTEAMPLDAAGSIDLVLDGPATVTPGETFSVNLKAQNIPEPGLYGVQLEVNYDPALISASNLQVNPDLSFVVFNSADNTAGRIRLVASQQGKVPGLTGDDVTLLTFDATATNSAGSVTFTFENVKLSDAQAQSFDFISQSYAVSITEPVTPEPTDEPTSEPTAEPTDEPTPEPTDEPTPEPTVEPTDEPTVEPTTEPTDEPTPEPTVEPTDEPTVEPTTEPTDEPTAEPTAEPTDEPTAEPTEEPTPEPTTANLSGQVILAGRADSDWSGAAVSLDENGPVSTTDATGNFSIADVAVGTLNYITADAPGYLSAVCTEVTVIAPETGLEAVSLLSGDIDDDDVVDITDATAVGASFGQTGQDLPADITQDGLIDIFDIVLVSVNFGQAGPQTWNCAVK